MKFFKILFVKNVFVQLFQINRLQKMSSNILIPHYDRCFNPYSREGHKGKGLQAIPKNLKRSFPNPPVGAKICADCRQVKIQRRNEAQENFDSIGTLLLPCNSFNDTLLSSLDNLNSSDEISERKMDLEEMLNGLKEKFSSLGLYDSQRLQILTVAPSSWSVRKISEEFGCSSRSAAKAKQLKYAKGNLAETTEKVGKRLPKETVDSVKRFYESNCNSKLMSGIKDVVSVKTNGKRLLM